MRGSPRPPSERASQATDSIAAKLSRYLSEQTNAPHEVVGLERFSGGFSWQTYRFRLEGAGAVNNHHYILRVGHPDGNLAPYSAAPEFRSLQTFFGTSVPVPQPRWFSDDESIIGAPFLICDFIEGVAPAPWNFAKEGEADNSERVADDFVTYLAAIHNHPWRHSPLKYLGRNITVENAAHKALDTWEARAERTALQPYPVITDAGLWLRRHAPIASRLSIVHGDYRLGNFLVRHGRISAVLDWELAHIGDPDEDIGWAFARIFSPNRDKVSGISGRNEFLDRYEELTGHRPDESAIRYYEIMTVFKIVCVNLGGRFGFFRRPGVDPRIGAIGNQLPIHLRLLNKLVHEV